MNIERSEFGGHAYTFSKDEEGIICKAFRAEVKKLEKKIERIEMHPDNEGQVTWLDKVDQLRNTIRHYDHIVSELELPF